jgi:hypothetical protein
MVLAIVLPVPSMEVGMSSEYAVTYFKILL